MVKVSARWKCNGPNGSLQKRYVKFESSGDQTIGRILSGLKQQSTDFLLNSPHFVDNIDDEIEILIIKMTTAVYGKLDKRYWRF